jgi:heme exporter protein D
LTVGWLTPLFLLIGVPDFARWLRAGAWAGGLSPGLWFLVSAPGLELLAAAALVWASARLRRSILRKEAARRIREDPVLRLRVEAADIARAFQVKMVAFGHTHKEDALRLPEDRWYYNTGTWITVYAEADNLFRLPRQFTFLLVEKGKGSLLHWDVATRSARRSIVVDPEAAHAPPEPTFGALLRKALRIRSLRGPIPGMNDRFEKYLERLTRGKR